MRFPKVLYVGLGVLFVSVGAVGAFLPVLPTVPFLLLAAWCFQRGSDRLHHWIISHQVFGPPIVDWQRHGVIRLRAKIIAAIMIVASFFYAIVFKANGVEMQVVLVCAASIILGFILSRPSKRSL